MSELQEGILIGAGGLFALEMLATALLLYLVWPERDEAWPG